MLQVTVCVLVSVSVLLVPGVRGQVSSNCSDKVVQEFAFGVPFKADIAELINRHFTSEQQCAKLSDYLWKKVADHFGRDLWQSSDEAARQRIGSSIITLVHYRAIQASAANRTDAQNEVEAMFKLDLFNETVFKAVHERNLDGYGPTVKTSLGQKIVYWVLVASALNLLVAVMCLDALKRERERQAAAAGPAPNQ